MDYSNPPAQAPAHVTHHTFTSALYGHEVGYNVYLPPDGPGGGQRLPVAYHLHGWTGHESTEVATMESVYQSRRAITVFPNNSPVIGERENLPVEAMFTRELMPHIDQTYWAAATRESRAISGFSMGGGMALYYAVKHPNLFSSVTAYAGTYHHYYHKDAHTVGAAPETAGDLLAGMLREGRDREEGNLLCVIRQNAEQIRGQLQISLCVGTEDILYCDNEILHLYLDALRIPHGYTVHPGVGHVLAPLL